MQTEQLLHHGLASSCRLNLRQVTLNLVGLIQFLIMCCIRSKLQQQIRKDNKGQQYFTFKLKVGAILTYFKWCEIQIETHDLYQTLINEQIDIKGDIFTSVFEALHVQLAIIHGRATTHDKVNMNSNFYSLRHFVIVMYWSNECRLNCMKQKLNNYIL